MKIFLQKFLKAFITGGFVAITATMATGISFSTLEEGKHAFIILLLAFLSGGFHASYNALFSQQ